MTQRTASITLDLPQPFGPTTPVRLGRKGTLVGSTKDLNPASFTLVRRISRESAYREKLKCRSVDSASTMSTQPTTSLETFPNPAPERDYTIA